MEALMTTNEVADRLRVSPLTVRRWRYRGLLGYVRVGNSVRYREEDVRLLIEQETRKEEKDGASEAT